MFRDKPPIPLFIIQAGVIALPLLVLPFAVIAYYRSIPHRSPRIHIFQDMADQPKLKAQAKDMAFLDHRAMRLPVPGTVARGQLDLDEAYEEGQNTTGDKVEYLDHFPDQVTLDSALMARGQQRFNIYCAPCHGQSGNGQGMVEVHSALVQTNGWITPMDLHTLAEDPEKSRPGYVFHVITHGGTSIMPPYAAQISVADRWAIAAYVKALQLSRHVKNEALPEADRLSPDAPGGTEGE